jgi:hypothetical protein
LEKKFLVMGHEKIRRFTQELMPSGCRVTVGAGRKKKLMGA